MLKEISKVMEKRIQQIKNTLDRAILRAKDLLVGITDDSQLFADNRGVGVVEVILILVVLIGLVVIFRDQLTSLINTIFGKITNDATAL